MTIQAKAKVFSKLDNCEFYTDMVNTALCSADICWFVWDVEAGPDTSALDDDKHYNGYRSRKDLEIKMYVEQDCTIKHNGQEFTSGGAVVTADRITAYLGQNGTLTDWHGNILGTYRVMSKWPIANSAYGTHMHQVEATVNGVVYTGRSMGEGLVYNGKVKVKGKR